VDGFSTLTCRVSWKANDEPTVAEMMAAQNTAEIQRGRIEGDKIDCAITSLQFLSSKTSSIVINKHYLHESVN
jgi:hypothetical protein